MSLFLALLVPLSAQASDNPGTGGDNPLPKILRDWAKRRQETGMITYRLSGTRTWLRGAFTPEPPPPAEDLDNLDENPPFHETSTRPIPPTAKPPAENPPQDVIGKFSATVTLDFQGNRCRVEHENDDFNNRSGLIEHYRVIYVGNGGSNVAHILQGVPNPPSAPLVDFLIQRGDRSAIPQSCFEHTYYKPLFLGSGVVPTGDQRVRVTDIAPAVDSSAFKFEGYSTEQGRRRAHFRVDYEKRYSETTDYWIDLEHDSAIVKYTIRSGGGKGLLVLLIDYDMASGIWLPKHWTKTATNHKGKAILNESVTVSDVARLTSIPGETFVLTPSPGMLVEEIDHVIDPKTKAFAVPALTVRKNHYRVNADGSRGEQTSEVRSNPGYDQ